MTCQAPSQSCTTPHHQQGSCLPLAQCGHIRKLLTIRITSLAHSYLRRSVCRFSGEGQRCMCVMCNVEEDSTVKYSTVQYRTVM